MSAPAEFKSPHDQSSATAIVVPHELTVILNPYGLSFSEFVGSRAMLEAEVIIPDGTNWPKGYDELCWQDGKFNYRLRRQRPEGAKGPRRYFAEFDWWCLQWQRIHTPTSVSPSIALKQKALADELYSLSAEGQEQWSRNYKRYLTTVNDEKFQAFKALVPGLIRPKRGRRSGHLAKRSDPS